MPEPDRGSRGFRRCVHNLRWGARALGSRLCAACAACALIVSESLAGQCALGKLVEFPITMVDLVPQMTAKINGTDVRLTVDSGASLSNISRASAAELNLSLRPAPMELVVRGVNGSLSASITRIKEFTLPGVVLHDIEFIVAGSQVDQGSVGLLGQNVLHYADVEYDLAQGVIRLWKPVNCGSKVRLAYWVDQSTPYSEINIESWERTSPAIGRASINGKDVRVMFDSGAEVSTLTLRAAARAGIRPDSPGVVPGGMMGGAGANMTPSYIAPVESFKVGDEEIRHTQLRFTDFQLGDVDMLLGADFFLSHRIYVANSRQKLYFTYNGGPVFNLTHLKPGAVPDVPASPAPAGDAAPASAAPAGDAAPAPPAPAGDAAPASAANRPPGETQATVADKGAAADFSRRGGAMASRGDYEHALTALSRACELAPDNPEYFFQRSRLYLQMENQVLAGKDLDQTLKLNPRHVTALVSRAELLLESGDETAATADLDSANRAATKQEDLRFEMAEAYESADRLSSAVEQFDLWIAAHGDDQRIPYAQEGRCRSRALAGSDLPLALKDCNAALKRAGKGTPLYARVADSRGLVFLRLGDYAKSIADYDVAIAIAPQSAWGWYGRGIDKLRQHQTAAGDSDIARAMSLSPEIAEKFTHHGIVP